ncbi:Hypothetical predicted protein, partial [Mytilus galloprovincialis]
MFRIKSQKKVNEGSLPFKWADGLKCNAFEEMSISGVLESAWCFEKLRIPTKLHEVLDNVESSLSGNGSKDMSVGGWFDVSYGSEYDSQYDDFMANRTALNYTTYLNMNYKYCHSMFPNEYHVNAYIGISIALFMLMFVGLRICVVDRSNLDLLTIVKTHADFIVLNLMVVLLLLAGMLSGIAYKYTSSTLTQSASQRSQSRIASIVIALY